MDVVWYGREIMQNRNFDYYFLKKSEIFSNLTLNGHSKKSHFYNPHLNYNSGSIRLVHAQKTLTIKNKFQFFNKKLAIDHKKFTMRSLHKWNGFDRKNLFLQIMYKMQISTTVLSAISHNRRNVTRHNIIIFHFNNLHFY